MLVSAIIDYIVSAIVHTRCGFSSYYFSHIDDTSVLLSINLTRTVDAYSNLNQIPSINHLLQYLVCERNYKVTTIDNQQNKDTVIIHLTLKSLRGYCTKVHKTSTFSYETNN